jgi:hypothetical protein
LASVTSTVNLAVPTAATAGVPASTPLDAFSVTPTAKDPAHTDHANGPVPPGMVSVSR